MAQSYQNMGKNKLKKFADMAGMRCVMQYPWAVLQEKGFDLRGHWGERYFSNNNPIVLELGCGKGEYTVELARRHPDRNFIGIDIKGARMWTGAKIAETEGLKNVAFLRTDIELIKHFFAPGEVSEIWITFCDPQMAKTRKRLTSTRFLNLYDEILGGERLIHLKTDSPFLYTYTTRLLDINKIQPEVNTADLYGDSIPADGTEEARAVQTFYEQQWLGRGKSIKYLRWHLPELGGQAARLPLMAPGGLSGADLRPARLPNLVEPREDDIPKDDYHSFQRGVAQCMPGIIDH